MSYAMGVDEISRYYLITGFLLIIIISTTFWYLFYKKRLHIKKWQKNLNLVKHAQVFHEIYQEVDGFSLSLQARQRQDAVEYVYGEIDFVSFIALLSFVPFNQETVFYDLGSGVGKAVLACSMVYPLKKSVGVECLPELYECSCKQALHLVHLKEYEERAKKITFIHSDFLKIDLDEATVIFINATTFIGTLWDNLCMRLKHLPQICIVITTSKALDSTDFIVLKHTKVQMSWGVVCAFIHKRKTYFD